MSIVTLQTSLLLGAFYGTEGDSLRENLYYSVACRIASLIDVPHCLEDTPLEKELGIRCGFLIYMIEDNRVLLIAK